MSEEKEKSAGWLSMAVYPTMNGMAGEPIELPEGKQHEALNLDELSVAEIKAYVNSGELTAEEVYEHESKAEHPRKSLLHAYEPKDEEAVDAPEGEGN
jgi:hypothetical protein